MSRKIERLINLTIALLATPRFLTKSEIFRTVEGYEGSAETKERMFERDKDDLRSLGIVIDVGSFDPLFSDEAGYRIRSEKYVLDLGNINSTEISLLSMAAQSWQGAAFADAAQSAILKLASIGIPADSIDIPGFAPKLAHNSNHLETITDGIANSNFLEFNYVSTQLEVQQRSVIPFALSNKNGLWYFSGVDQDIQEIRTFRLDRIRGAIETKHNSEIFEYPDTFDFASPEFNGPSVFALLDVRKGKGTTLRSLAISTEDLGEWDRMRIPMFSIDSLIGQILWHGEDVFVQEPENLRLAVIRELEAVVRLHE